MELNEQMIKSWLDRINEWERLGIGGKCILDMTDSLTELEQFLTQLKDILTKLEPREILSRSPSVPKFLHGLLSNVLVQTTETLYRVVMLCIAALSGSSASSHQRKDGINEKSIKWVKSQFKTVCSSYPEIVSSSASYLEQFGLQPVDVTEQFNNELVNCLVDDLSNTTHCCDWSDLHRQFIPRYNLKGTTLRNISEMCLPILSKLVVRPLIKALLCCENANDVITYSNSSSANVVPEQALSPHFLNALKHDPKERYLNLSPANNLLIASALSHDALVNLWMQDHVYFEHEIICLLEICCFERKYMSHNKMKEMISLRELPKALSENMTLFSIIYEMIQRVIYETNGNIYVIKFVGILLQLISDVQMRKNKTQLADLSNVNYASIWSDELTSFVNLLTVNWVDMQENYFLYHTKMVEDSINEMCRRITLTGCQPWYIWLILQGFPDQLQGCYWFVLFGSTKFVETCLTILLWYHGGGAQFDNNSKIKMKNFIDTLRHLSSKDKIVTSDILCAIDNMDLTNFRENAIIRHLATLFMLISCSVDTLDICHVISKLTKDLSVPNAFDQLLDVVEETFSFQSNSRWLSTTTFSHNTSNTLKIISTNSLQLLSIMYKSFDEYVSQHSAQGSIQDASLDIQTNMISDLRSRFESLSKLLRKETG